MGMARTIRGGVSLTNSSTRPADDVHRVARIADREDALLRGELLPFQDSLEVGTLRWIEQLEQGDLSQQLGNFHVADCSRRIVGRPMGRYLQKISLRPYTDTDIWAGWELEGRNGEVEGLILAEKVGRRTGEARRHRFQKTREEYLGIGEFGPKRS